jgi:predicted nucleic acid-binding protein
VICQPAKRSGDSRVVAWLEREKDRCYTSAVVIAQLAYWVRTKQGKQRQALQNWLARLVNAMPGRIYGFNVEVAHVWAEQEHLFEKAGKPMPVEDSYIAATAKRYGLTIVTKCAGFPPRGPESRRSVQAAAESGEILKVRRRCTSPVPSSSEKCHG